MPEKNFAFITRNLNIPYPILMPKQIFSILQPWNPKKDNPLLMNHGIIKSTNPGA